MAGGGDVWPGDALLLESASLDLAVQVAVRAVTLEYGASSPDVGAVCDRVFERLGERSGDQDEQDGACGCVAAGGGFADLSG